MKLKKEYCIAVITASMLMTTGLGATASFSEVSASEIGVANSASIHTDTTVPKIKMIKGKNVNTVEIVLYDAGGFNMDSLWDKSN